MGTSKVDWIYFFDWLNMRKEAPVVSSVDSAFFVRTGEFSYRLDGGFQILSSLFYIFWVERSNKPLLKSGWALFICSKDSSKWGCDTTLYCWDSRSLACIEDGMMAASSALSPTDTLSSSSEFLAMARTSPAKVETEVALGFCLVVPFGPWTSIYFLLNSVLRPRPSPTSGYSGLFKS